ncbi:MAG TPA: IS66 family transposase [Verrucomicrobiae bacterium]|jgi:transposase|nr:IS66 family transposase [Verrucomicrobiae bacterium]
MISLDSLSTEARQAFEGLQGEVGRLEQVLRTKDQIIELQEQKIRLLNIKLWGPKGDTISPAQTALLFEEASVTPAEIQQEASQPPAQKENPLPRAKATRPHHPGREKLPDHLERREVIIPCHPKDCRCDQCGAERPIIGYERSEELVCDPATFHVRVTLREKRGSHCQDEQGVATAPAPAKIVPKSKLSNELIIEALARKYQQHTPVYRQCAALADNHGIDLSLATLTSGILAAGGLLAAVVRAQAEELRKTSCLQADETTVPVQTGEKTGRNHRAYIWEYGQPGGPVVFEFQMGRGRDGPEKFLRGFRGTLQCDGYAAYDQLGEGIVYAGCVAHARRGFVEAGKLAPQNPLPTEIVERIRQLYAVEEKARQAGLGPVERAALRQSQSAPVMEALKLRLVDIRQQIPPGGKLAQACDYTLGQWSRLEEYLKNGQVEIDNNWCEGSMRPLALGRKNWLHLGSPEAGPKVAAIASIVETCRRLEVNLRAYLKDVLPKLGDWSANRVAELTPTVWKAAQNKS